MCEVHCHIAQIAVVRGRPELSDRRPAELQMQRMTAHAQLQSPPAPPPPPSPPALAGSGHNILSHEYTAIHHNR